MTTSQLARRESTSASRTGNAPPLVCIVVDDAPARESLETVVGSAGWESQAFSSAEQFLSRAKDSVPRCLILGVSLPDLDGLALQRRVAVDRGETPVIFVSPDADVATVVKAMKGGATEFFTNPVREDLLLTAVAHAIEQSRIALARGAEQRMLSDRHALLSARERQVLSLVVAGRLNKQIADELKISEITVKAHRGRMMRKMQVRTVPDLMKILAKLGQDE